MTESEKEPNIVAVETLRKRLEELTSDNSKLKKENVDLKDKLAKTIPPEQVQRLRNDNKRLIGLTERLNNQRSTMEERFKEKKGEVVELEKQVEQRDGDINQIVTDRDKMKELVETLLKDIEKHKAEIRVLKDGKTFADFVELKRQIKELKDENLALSNGLIKSDRKGSVKFNLNDIATMLRLKEGGDAFTQRVQNHRVVVLDERELEESIRRSEEPTTDINSPISPTTPTHRPLTCRRTSSVNRINFISPPRSLATSPRIFSRQSSKEQTPTWNGSGTSRYMYMILQASCVFPFQHSYNTLPTRTNGEKGEFRCKTTVFPSMAFTRRTKRTIPISFTGGLDEQAIYRRSLGIYKEKTKRK